MIDVCFFRETFDGDKLGDGAILLRRCNSAGRRITEGRQTRLGSLGRRDPANWTRSAHGLGALAGKPTGRPHARRGGPRLKALAARPEAVATCVNVLTADVTDAPAVVAVS